MLYTVFRESWESMGLGLGSRSEWSRNLQTWQTESWSFSLSLSIFLAAPFSVSASFCPTVPLAAAEPCCWVGRWEDNWMMEKTEIRKERQEAWVVTGERGSVLWFNLIIKYQSRFPSRKPGFGHLSWCEHLSLAMWTALSPHTHTPHRTQDCPHYFPQTIQSMERRTRKKSQWNPAPKLKPTAASY